MTHNQTASDSLHPPVIAGVPAGGESRGLFAPMKTPEEYEQEIADRDRMIEKLKEQLVKALEVIAQQHAARIIEERRAS